MTIFDLDRAILADYERFARSFTDIRAEDLRTKVDDAYCQGAFWPQPMVQLNPKFEEGTSVDALVRAGELQAGCEIIFRDAYAAPNASDRSLKLHKHQLDAVTHASAGKSFVVTSGTGSGKSACYFLPIVDRILRAKVAGEPARTRAIIIYPMNALANSQLEEIDNRLRGSGFEDRISARIYTGQQDSAKRDQVRDEIPDILLTNFMMLELLLTRREGRDRTILEHCEGLEFLVLDELHTYRGRQGADVAMLVRRVRERLERNDRPIQCIGTSATMASDASTASLTQVAKVASLLFATPITAAEVVTECLERRTDKTRAPDRIAREELAQAVINFDPEQASDERLKHDPFMIWIEMTLGLSGGDNGQRLKRAQPSDLEIASGKLAEATGLSDNNCRNRLELALQTAGKPADQRGGEGNRPFFPVRLHRIISGAGRLFATIEAVDQRGVTFDAQKYMPGRDLKARLYPTYFCRSCGQEHHPVRLVQTETGPEFQARAIDDAAPDDDEVEGADGQPREIAGFLTPVTNDDIGRFAGDDVDYPDEWLEETRSGTIRLKRAYRGLRLQRHHVTSDGSLGPGGMACWFQPGRFRLCAACGTTHSHGRDINRLAGLTAEGRSSATTVLVSSMLRRMKDGDQPIPGERQKVLGFSDNRQDAALQAGHFNDFIFVALLRAAVLAVLEQGTASDASIGRRLVEALGFDGRYGDRSCEWLSDPDLEGRARENATADLAAVLAYRFWHDQRRGWRHTFPNLEQLGLIKVRYANLAELCADSERFVGPLVDLASLSSKERLDALRTLLDGGRQGLAVQTDALDPNRQHELLSRRKRLLAPWGFADDETPRDAAMLVVGRARRGSVSEQERYVRTGLQSAIGKQLRKILKRRLNREEHEHLLLAMTDLLRRHGLLVEVPVSDESLGFRLAADAIEFLPGDPADDRGNRYFSSLYPTLAQQLIEGGALLFGDEAREHTAQVEQQTRQFREWRFRWGESERAELAEHRSTLRQISEPDRFLPVMFCSPTMELGVDISELDIVYLRNVPPSPANYAQRSGRAGRSGSPALVLTYCSAQSPHDQYFFERREDMIQGVVRPPTIDLGNRDLVESHLHAVWLASVEGEELSGSIPEVLDTSAKERPLRANLAAAIAEPDLQTRAGASMTRLLGRLAEDYGQSPPAWFDGPEAVAERVRKDAALAFDKTFDRWRTLLAAAEQQRDEGRRILDNFGITDRAVRHAADWLQRMAQRQIDALLAGSDHSGNDFYTYRYLATEGFLPGYNFPRLPLMAFIPGDLDRKRRSYVQRPRFLGISEFGPHSRIYHEGRAYRVVRAQMPASELAVGGGRLLTGSIHLCRNCGACHVTHQPERCHACDSTEGWRTVREVKKIENLATRPAEHITANDEERQRQGFELVTTFSWARKGERLDVQRAEIQSSGGGDVLATVDYGPSASMQRLNLGLRRRRERTELGFEIDPTTGRWLGRDTAAEAAAAAEDDPIRGQPQRIVPMVEDSKNALLLRPVDRFVSETTAAVVQYALLRGIETEFQLEEGELLAEPMPSRGDRRAILFYEATEGGAGVLGRIVCEEDGLARAARTALELMHFKDRGENWTAENLDDDGKDRCVDACYRCLLSYYNQPEHEIIRRHDEASLEFLCALANSTTRNARSADLVAPRIGQQPAVQEFLATLEEQELPEPKIKSSGSGTQLTWQRHMVVGLFGDTAADRQTLQDLDYIVVDIPPDAAAWPDAITRLQRRFSGAGS